MYKPKFCVECGSKILRLRWHFWTSRRFCGKCARRFRNVRFTPPLFAMIGLLGTGFLAGLMRRPAPPPLIIERRSDSPLTDTSVANSTLLQPSSESKTSSNNPINSPPALEEVVYLCGARTKKGTPCSRRVHGPVRCWQHKGMAAMLPQEKLIVTDLAP